MTPELTKIVMDAKDPSTANNVFTAMYSDYKQVRDLVISRKLHSPILASIDAAIIELSYRVKDLKNIVNEDDLEIAASYTRSVIDDCYLKINYLKDIFR